MITRELVASSPESTGRSIGDGARLLRLVRYRARQDVGTRPPVGFAAAKAP